jgi:hypothetical protein
MCIKRDINRSFHIYDKMPIIILRNKIEINSNTFKNIINTLQHLVNTLKYTMNTL